MKLHPRKIYEGLYEKNVPFIRTISYQLGIKASQLEVNLSSDYSEESGMSGLHVRTRERFENSSGAENRSREIIF